MEMAQTSPNLMAQLGLFQDGVSIVSDFNGGPYRRLDSSFCLTSREPACE